MISYIRQNGPKCDANLSAESIKARSDAEILARVSIAFRSFSDKYKAYWKDKPKPTSSTAKAVTTQREVESKRSARRHARKVAVSFSTFELTILLNHEIETQTTQGRSQISKRRHSRRRLDLVLPSLVSVVR